MSAVLCLRFDVTISLIVPSSEAAPASILCGAVDRIMCRVNFAQALC